jgi:ubiquinone/menaquinone biosynthesis C-methylase UbiE
MVFSRKGSLQSNILDNLENELVDSNNTLENAQKYLQADFKNTYYLGYRDIPFLLSKYVQGKKALDYGCGTGRSTRFLKMLGLDTIGVDVSKPMLGQALTIDKESRYFLIKSGELPFQDNSFDLIFSCYVLFVIPSKEELLAIFKEIYRCLEKGGIFIAVTGTEDLYSYKWLSYNVDFPQNIDLYTGKPTRIQLKDLNIDFVNYFWKDSDYCQLFQDSKLEITEKHYPLGRDEDNMDWVSEREIPPYVVYILKKN